MKKLTFLILLLLSACTTIAPTRAPLLSPFGDGTQWIVWEDMQFVAKLNDHTQLSIIVPRGFVTDLASTPKEIWSIYPPFGKYLSAAILHDYLYWRQECEPKEADEIIYQTMRDAGVDQATQSRFYAALQAAGDAAWVKNKSERANHLVRVIPSRYLSISAGLLRPTTLWPQLRKELHKSNIFDEPTTDGESIKQACKALGNEIVVKSGISAIVLGK